MENNKQYLLTEDDFKNLFEKLNVNTDSWWYEARIEEWLEEKEISEKPIYREDIESLGWELDSCVKKECFYIHKSSNLINGDYRLICHEKEETIEILNDVDNFCFYGKIKNKLELQKLMNHLNIL